MIRIFSNRKVLSVIAALARRSILKRLAGVTLISVSLAGMSAAVHAQSSLFSPVTSAADSGAKTDLVARIAAEPTTKSLDLVRIDLHALQSDAIVLSLRDGDAVVNKRRTEVRGNNDYSWFGTVFGASPVSNSVILVVMNGNVIGSIDKGLDRYSIRPVGNGVHAVIGIDSSKFGAD